VFVVSRTELEPLAHLSYQSDVAFDWGRLTEGALELAFAILAHTTQSQPTDLVSQAFCGEVVARLGRAGFVLSDGDVALWLLTAFCETPLGTDRGSTVRSGSTGAPGGFRSWLRRT